MSYKSDTIDKYKQLQTSLEKLQKDVAADLEQIRKDKLEIQGIKQSIDTLIKEGYYLRDDKRIIISAPEIIIGNVGRDGTLLANGSKVVLRAQNIGLEGVGVDECSVGRVVTRASNIANIAVDPGIDGGENVVRANSSIVNMARKVVLQSEDAEGVFLSPSSAAGTGISIISDTNIDVNALAKCESHKDVIKDMTTTLKEEKTALSKECSAFKTEIKDAISILDNIVMFGIAPITLTDLGQTLANQDMVEYQEDFEDTADQLYRSMSSFFAKASRLAEVNRQISSLEAAEKARSSKSSSFKTKNVQTHINLNSECIGLSSVDGDGNIRETPASKVTVNTRSFSVSTLDKDGKQIKDSGIKMLSNMVEISTVDPKITDKGAEYPALGDVKIVSKNIVMEAVDYKLEDKKTTEALLTKDGSISMRASTISGDTTSTDGKNEGMLSLNAKRVEIKSMDVDKDKRTDKSMTSAGVMLLNSEKMYVGGSGSDSEKENSKLLQLVSSEVGLFAKKTAEMQQGKALVQLVGDKLSVSGSEAAIYGKTKMQGEVTFSGKATGPSAEFKSVSVSTVFKGPSISDGMGVASGGSGGSLSAKLKQEQVAKAPETKK